MHSFDQVAVFLFSPQRKSYLYFSKLNHQKHKNTLSPPSPLGHAVHPWNRIDGFLVAVVLPKGTNEVLEHPHTGGEDALLAAKNKWLIGHPEGGLPEGSYIGLTGENLEIK